MRRLVLALALLERQESDFLARPLHPSHPHLDGTGAGHNRIGGNMSDGFKTLTEDEALMERLAHLKEMLGHPELMPDQKRLELEITTIEDSLKNIDMELYKFKEKPISFEKNDGGMWMRFGRDPYELCSDCTYRLTCEQKKTHDNLNVLQEMTAPIWGCKKFLVKME